MIEAGIVERANAFLAKGDKGGAIALIETAASAGQADALFQMTLWLLGGHPLPRDLPAARQSLRGAVQAGHADAALMEVALTANGSGAAPDWRTALTRLRVAAAKDGVAAGHLALVDAMDLDATGAPRSLPAPERLSASPDVMIYRALLTPQECQHIAQIAHASLAPAVVIDPATGKMITHPIRTSHGTVVGPTWETLAIGAINRRLAAASGTQLQQGEPLAVLHYSPGQQYRPHFDTIGGAANQRVKTALVYLNHGYGGGETQFMANGLKVAARMGDVVLFGNVLPDGTPDPRSQHAGLPVTHGAKWLATRWIRAAPYDPWYPA